MLSYTDGLRQSLGLARALIADPPLLILDEPTDGLDPRGRREIPDILQDLAADGVGFEPKSHVAGGGDR